MKIKKNDNILIISGKDRARKGKVFQVFPKQNKIAVQGINIKKKHVKPKKTGEKGQVIEIPKPFFASTAKFICPKCSKAVRLGYKVVEKKKYRICKKCKAEI